MAAPPKALADITGSRAAAANRQKSTRRPGRMLKRKPKLRADGTADAITRQISEAQRKRLAEAPATPERRDRASGGRQHAPCLRRRQKKSRSRAAALLEEESGHQVQQRLDFAACSDSDGGAAGAENDALHHVDTLTFDALEDQENRTPPPSTVASDVFSAASAVNSGKRSTRTSELLGGKGKRVATDAVTLAKAHMAATTKRKRASSGTPGGAVATGTQGGKDFSAKRKRNTRRDQAASSDAAKGKKEPTTRKPKQPPGSLVLSRLCCLQRMFDDE